MKKSLIVAAVTLLVFAGAASAHAPIDVRQHRQHDRIAQGVASGSLTPREAARLAAEQRAIRHEERAYRADGHLSRWERADLQRDLGRASRHIYRERHDGQRRF
jgi:hypothetical protein